MAGVASASYPGPVTPPALSPHVVDGWGYPGDTVNLANVFLTVDVTPLVQSWVSGTPNYGIWVRAASAQTTTSVSFDSKEATNTSHAAYLDVTVASMGPAGPQGPPASGCRRFRE